MFKTDYVDAAFTGNRTYAVTMNGTRTTNVSIEDTTLYTQEGSQVGAKEFNEFGAELNRHNHQVSVTLQSSGWSANAPYSQTVAVNGMKPSDIVLAQPDITSSTSAASTKMYKKMYSLIDDIVTGTNAVTFYCNAKKPSNNFAIRLTGVSE